MTRSHEDAIDATTPHSRHCRGPPPAAPPLMPNVGPCDGCLMVVTTCLPRQLPNAWQTPMVVVDLPSPSGVGFMPLTTTSEPSGASFIRSATFLTSTLALWRPQGMTSSLLSPALRATRSMGSGVHACEITMSLGTGCKRFTCVVGGDAGRGDCDRLARNVSFRDSCSEEDTRVRGLF